MKGLVETGGIVRRDAAQLRLGQNTASAVARLDRLQPAFARAAALRSRQGEAGQQHKAAAEEEDD